ncbi:MAG: MmcQ family protein, partial [Alphaproteobacteria bacterium]|nr:MmcQ family protein [Alphaproteobacteria bacterium]
MSIESEIFKKAVVDFAKLEAYGFEKQADGCTLQKIFKNGDFRADVSVDKQGNVSGKVYEIATDEEFLPLRVENMGG